ncbi:hypothetical protein [Leucobacter denitrificans]|uniref:Uncharacterized protein n=1 Tax=Leucobacter denitrificans TaxID=683042 RepID=A0A7G9S756_9MICO|nr:hypothetical protein [Leucobacter denitrificans]QNN63681.1 hypothetical protein H9L06_05140 [Leucobacter denitrificans]
MSADSVQRPSEPPISHAARFASLATAALIVCVLVSIALPLETTVAGVAALVALVGCFLVATAKSRIVVLLLTGVGVLSAIIALTVFDARLEWDQLGRVNQDLVAMIAGGAFIRGVVPLTLTQPKPRLTGTAALLRTSFLTHFFSSVLNMVSIGIVGDRLARNGKLSRNNASLVSHSFATAALWSPFWAITALIVIYFPHLNLLPVTLTGMAGAVMILIVIALWNAARRTPQELAEPGYPLQASLLWLPLALIGCVIATHFLIPGTPVPRLVLLASIIVPLLFGTVRTGLRETLAKFARVATSGLTSSANESALFIAAGIFTVGGSMLTANLPITLAGVPPTVFSAWLLTVAIMLLSLLGVHSIVSISIAAALMLFTPGSEYLYATAMAWGWSLSGATGPLSGTIIYVSQRYSLNGRSLIAANLPVALFMVALAFPAIWIVARLSEAWGLA